VVSFPVPIGIFNGCVSLTQPFGFLKSSSNRRPRETAISCPKVSFFISLALFFALFAIPALIFIFLFNFFAYDRAGPDSMQLPTAHTCFNTLILPDYGNDYGKLERLMGRAVLECEGFGLQ
jgi:hypothetical protein